ncbi:DUF927 domain-containing protein [Methylorubrum extorquens]|uniref:DUF927 domain-containing protein n=1 Tax=Methylorubrum extorquens TaxID=408 RepID=UPI001EE5177A|nr:DUF927 domain-containing protein [Methylorubrum extorquens]MCG5249063.1 DUF927 domain-containing protein [Methylorubrum extorquens]
MPGEALVPCRKPARREPQHKTVKLERTRTVPPPVVVKIARVVDEATGLAFDRFAATSDLGDPVLADVPCEKSEKVSEVLAALRKHNAALTTKASADAIQTAIDLPPKCYLRHASQPGWYKGGQDAFVRPTHVVGAVSAVAEMLPPRPEPGKKRQIVFANAGTVEGFQREVVRRARWSTRAMLMLGVPFAGPLLRVLGMQSWGINLYGKPKVGKSTVQVVGGSVIGLGTEAALPSFKATITGLDRIAITSNDGALFVNEAGLLGRNAYATLSPMIYGLSEGKDKVRAGESVYASDAAASGWSLVYVLSSENAIEALALQAGTTRQGGEVARCLDLPAVHSGNATVFDCRPPGLTDEAFTRWAHRQMAEIRKACAANHGVVFDAYLRGLMELGDTLKPRAQAYVDEFVASLFLKDADGAVLHAARNFGTIYAGLRLAMDFGVLPPPWRARAVRRAVKACFRDGLKVSRLRDTTLEEAKAILHQRLQDTALPRKQDLQPKSDVGFCTLEGDIEVVSIRSAEFVRWFEGKPAHLYALLAWLDEQGALRKSHEGKRPIGRGYEWAVTSPRAPGFKGRCIVLRLPIPK